jgi:putative hemolysin
MPLKGGPCYWLLRSIFILLIMLGGILLVHAGSTRAVEQGIPSGMLWIIGGLVFILLLCSGGISSSETALFSLDKLELSSLRNSQLWQDRLIVSLLDRANDTLITILILNNLINIAISLAIGHLMEQLFFGNGVVAFGLAAFLATTVILLFGEILPKMMAQSHSLRFARLCAAPLMSLTWLLGIPRIIINMILHGLFRFLHIPDEGTPAEEFTDEELKAMIQSGEVDPVIDEDEREMIDGVFQLRRITVSDIVTPRNKVISLPDSLGQEDMINRLREVGNNRVLIYRESLDNLQGFLLVKEVLFKPREHWRNHLREILCVPEGLGLLDLLKQFRVRRTKLAAVVDEFGQVEGVVSLQDVLEKIVGDIYEKHEMPEQDIMKVHQDSWRVAGSVELDDISEQVHESFPDNRGRTLGGFVMNTLGRIPHEGDTIEHGELQITVREMMGRCVHDVIIKRVPMDTSHEDFSAEDAL